MKRCPECGRRVVSFFDHLTVDCMNESDIEVMRQMIEEDPDYEEKLEQAVAEPEPKRWTRIEDFIPETKGEA